MSDNTETRDVPKVYLMGGENHGPSASPGLTAREYREMKEEEYWERQAYLDYINEY
jgi:hypothetical protein